MSENKAGFAVGRHEPIPIIARTFNAVLPALSTDHTSDDTSPPRARKMKSRTLYLVGCLIHSSERVLAAYKQLKGR